MLSSLSGPLYFSPKCRKHVYRLYHHTRDCTIPACKLHLHWSSDRLSLSEMPFVGPMSAPCVKGIHSRTNLSFHHLLLRLQKMCTASHAISRQPAVHRGVAHTRYCDISTSDLNVLCLKERRVHTQDQWLNCWWFFL